MFWAWVGSWYYDIYINWLHILSMIWKKSLNTEIHTIGCNSKGYADNKFQLLTETIIALKNNVGDKRKYNQTINHHQTKAFNNLCNKNLLVIILFYRSNAIAELSETAVKMKYLSLRELPASVSSALDKPGIVERFLKQ